MEPPFPPSPPSGPPRGMNFSRRKLMAPRPPCPAVTSMSTSSTNMGEDAGHVGGGHVTPRAVTSARGGSPLRFGLRDAGWDDADEASARPVIFELDAAADLREQGVVFAEADVQAR